MIPSPASPRSWEWCRSAVLVLRGEPGMGMTAPLEHAGRRATGCGIARVGGIESEGAPRTGSWSAWRS
ncbi:hypothetical protein [Streptomyces sp. NRRL S-1022]|uniref:hypothetical protein n=1 Tax=Streptomyces sp. NRRL S-1022 TaxID=1463880 RepID=UPI0004BF7880|nr:hypothetical protein [Streptomyces sp. NRRL S-1022]